MTAITTTARSAKTSDSLLRLAMRVDAVLVGITGIVLLAAAGWFAELTGLPVAVEYGVGIFSVAYGIAVLVLAAIERVRPAGIGTVIANALCTVLAVVAVVTMSLTAAGVVLVIGMGLYTAVMAEWQFVGVRRIPA
ncbi:hypothetical protein [Mycolicibacterium goodii]|uniref:hypothetical protein n=1 Tax=Mycolicibacterium goodii TaxID=134601 RepID=UPI000C258C6B|nr:hypothetical protein [Mycolicibacterium goodii]MBU8813550.1 hypothetical protein [Mycolicibacterium goodii]MBU8834286.1 hypothetical protein [Mycolicibacterium goodii]PJK20621.1 hypothetical protein CSX11_19555 [Mycolicibacterium goodii]ULN46382.1 hypothetical protein MI170_24270 [Mycolicibacterium goodii]